MSDGSSTMTPSEAVTVIDFEFILDGMVAADGRTPTEVQGEVIDAIEAVAAAAARSVGAAITDVKWTISRRRRA